MKNQNAKRHNQTNQAPYHRQEEEQDFECPLGGAPYRSLYSVSYPLAVDAAEQTLVLQCSKTVATAWILIPSADGFWKRRWRFVWAVNVHDPDDPGEAIHRLVRELPRYLVC